MPSRRRAPLTFQPERKPPTASPHVGAPEPPRDATAGAALPPRRDAAD